CLASSRDCTYHVARVPFDGGPGKALLDDAILARRFPDGSLVFRRLGGARGERRDWVGASVWLAPRDGVPKQLVEHAAMFDAFPSPDGRLISLTTTDGAHSLVAADRAGELKAKVASDGWLVGWAAKEL